MKHSVICSGTLAALLTLAFSQLPTNAQQPEAAWEELSDMPVNTAWSDACVLDGKVYAVKGSIYVYDPVADSWEATGAFIPSGDQAVTVLGDRIYATNGALGFYEYDPATNEVTQKADCKFNKRATPIVALDGKIYAIGGVDQASKRLTAFEMYDPATDAWEQLEPLPFPWGWQAACVIEGQIYVFGGADAGGAAVSTVMSYDPVTGIWTERALLPDPRVFLHKSAPLIGDKVCIIGGYRFEGRSDMFIYDPVTDSWETGPDMPTARFGHAVTSVGAAILAFGGCIGADFQNQTQVNTVEVYHTGEVFAVEPAGKLATTWAMVK